MAAELHDEDYAATVRAMGFRYNYRQRTRRAGHPWVFICVGHMIDEELNAALSSPRWQTLLDGFAA